MLKFAKTAALVLTASFGINATAHANVEEALANICTIVSADDKGELRKKMRAVQSDYRLKLHDYYSGITCNGQSLIRTALQNNATASLDQRQRSAGSRYCKRSDGSSVRHHPPLS